MIQLDIQHCVLSCLQCNVCSDDRQLRDRAYSAIESLCWEDFPRGDVLRNALRAMQKDPFLGQETKDRLRDRLLSHHEDPLSLSSMNARTLANVLRVEKVEDCVFFRKHASLCKELGVPGSSVGLTPTGFVNACRKRSNSTERMTEFFESSRVCTLLQSKKSSLKAMAAGLSTWAKFCDLAGLPEFPICADDAISYAGICRSHGTYAQYVSHLKVACEILGHPTGWRDDERISQAADGIKKSGALQRTPKLAVSKMRVESLATNMADAIQE